MPNELSLQVYDGDGVLESEIQYQILTYLWYNKVFCWKNDSVGIYDAKRQCYRRKNSKFQIKGVADILGVYKGRPLAIEVKSKTGRLSEHQREFLDEFKYQGGIAFVARSLRDIDTELFLKHGR